MARIYWEPPKPGDWSWVINGENVIWEGGPRLLCEKIQATFASGFRLSAVKVGTDWWWWEVEKAQELKPNPHTDLKIAQGYGTSLEDAKHRAEVAVGECWVVEAASRAQDGWPPTYQKPNPCIECDVICKRHEAACWVCPKFDRTTVSKQPKKCPAA